MERIETQKIHLDQESLHDLMELDPAGNPITLRSLVHLFFKNAPKHLANIQGEIQNNDADGIAREAHAFRSICANLGAFPLASLCRELEAVGRRGELTNTKSLLKELKYEYQEVVVDLQEKIPLPL